MKNLFSSLLLFFFTSLACFGQLDYKVTSGMAAFKQKDYKTAIEDLNEALDNISELNANNCSMAFLYRGKSKVELLYKSTVDNNKEASSLYKNALFEAWNDFENALEYDNGLNEESIKKEISSLYNPLLQTGLSMLQSVFDNIYTGEEVSGVLKYANKCLQTALEIKETYIAYDILAQIELTQQDSIAALHNFKMALYLFKKDEMRETDLLIGYVYYRIALIKNYTFKNPDTSIIVLKEGQLVLNTEFQKLKETKAQYSNQDWENIEFEYNNIMDDLKTLELDTYLTAKKRSAEGIAKFEDALEKKPDDYMILVGYGSLLEKEDTENAILVYKKAIGIDGKKDLAFYNLGVLYFNMGAKLNEKARLAETVDTAAIFKDEAQVYFAEALPYLQRAFEIDPYSLGTLEALKQISLITNREEDFKLYQEFENKILKKID